MPSPPDYRCAALQLICDDQLHQCLSLVSTLLCIMSAIAHCMNMLAGRLSPSLTHHEKGKKLDHSADCVPPRPDLEAFAKTHEQ